MQATELLHITCLPQPPAPTAALLAAVSLGDSFCSPHRTQLHHAPRFVSLAAGLRRQGGTSGNPDTALNLCLQHSAWLQKLLSSPSRSLRT